MSSGIKLSTILKITFLKIIKNVLQIKKKKETLVVMQIHLKSGTWKTNKQKDWDS